MSGDSLDAVLDEVFDMSIFGNFLDDLFGFHSQSHQHKQPFNPFNHPQQPPDQSQNQSSDNIIDAEFKIIEIDGKKLLE